MMDNANVQVLLRGGFRDGIETEIPSRVEELGFARLKMNFDHVQPVSPDGCKHYSWDDDAMSVLIDHYRLTNEVINGRVVYQFID